MQIRSSIAYHDGMPEEPVRRKSTLSVARAIALARPLGAPLPTAGGTADDMTLRGGFARGAQPAGMLRPLAPAVSTRGARGASTIGANLRPSAVAAAAREQNALVRREREDRDRTIVVVLITAFVVVVSVLMAVRIRTSSRQSASREALQQTFQHVYTRQSEFRSIFGRFATWPELKARGVGIGPRQRVLDWRADRSHWFLSVRDTTTGVECDRTGELFDEDASERLPVCRPAR